MEGDDEGDWSSVGVVAVLFPRRSSRTNLKRERKQIQTIHQPNATNAQTKSNVNRIEMAVTIHLERIESWLKNDWITSKLTVSVILAVSNVTNSVKLKSENGLEVGVSDELWLELSGTRGTSGEENDGDGGGSMMIMFRSRRVEEAGPGRGPKMSKSD